jgi:hypothetical protein
MRKLLKQTDTKTGTGEGDERVCLESCSTIDKNIAEMGLMTTVRACIYVRSAAKLPRDSHPVLATQLEQARRFCNERGWIIASEFIENGGSGTSEDRPVFQAMIARALSAPAQFDNIVIEHESRLFRSERLSKIYRK